MKLNKLFIFVPLMNYLATAEVKDYSSLILGLSKTTSCSKIEQRFETTVVSSNQAKAKGLSERPEPLKNNEAMLFIYNPPQRATFWMKNTLIPLSIGFFDTKGKLTKTYEMPVEKQPAIPNSFYPSEILTSFVLEANPKKISEKSLGQVLCVLKK